MVNGEIFVGWCIKNSESNSKLFYPRGSIGKGYVVPSESEYKKLVKQISAYNLCSVPIFILAVSYLPGYFGLIAFVLLLLAIMAVFSMKAKKWERTDEKMTYDEGRAANKGKGFGFFLYAVWSVSVYAFIIGLSSLGESGARVTAVLLLISSILCIVLWRVLTRI